MFKNWTNRDWYWLLGVLIGIIILLVASIFSKSVGVEVNFSIISSAVSIALALVAIFFAWKQDSDNQVVTRETSNLLTKITTKIESMDNKIDKLDPQAVTAPAESQLINEIEKKLKEKASENNPDLIKEINQIVSEKFDEINDNLSSYYNKKQPELNYAILIDISNNKNEDVINKMVREILRKNKLFSIAHEVHDDVVKMTFSTSNKFNLEKILQIIESYGFVTIDYRTT